MALAPKKVKLAGADLGSVVGISLTFFNSTDEHDQLSRAERPLRVVITRDVSKKGNVDAVRLLEQLQGSDELTTVTFEIRKGERSTAYSVELEKCQVVSWELSNPAKKGTQEHIELSAGKFKIVSGGSPIEVTNPLY